MKHLQELCLNHSQHATIIMSIKNMKNNTRLKKPSITLIDQCGPPTHIGHDLETWITPQQPHQLKLLESSSTFYWSSGTLTNLTVKLKYLLKEPPNYEPLEFRTHINVPNPFHTSVDKDIAIPNNYILIYQTLSILNN